MSATSGIRSLVSGLQSLVAFAAAACVLAGNAHSQSFPTRPIRIVIPYAAAGGSDITTRIVQARATEALGQSICPMLVEPGKNFASAVSRIRDNGISPDMAAFFAGIAIQAYCPSLIASIADGSVLNQLGTGVPPGLNAFQIPGP